MNLFRSEEHVDRWCGQWRLERGAILTLGQSWRLAKAWYEDDRRDPNWRRRNADETKDLFIELGLTSPYWNLSPA